MPKNCFSNAPPNQARIFVDASHTCASGKNSGIERVVRSIQSECRQWRDSLDMPAPTIVTFNSDNFFPIVDRVQNHYTKLASLHSNLQSNLPSWYTRLASWCCSKINSPRLHKWFLPVDGHLGAFKLPHNIYNAMVRKSLPLYSRPIVPCENDVFLLPDAYWA